MNKNDKIDTAQTLEDFFKLSHEDRVKQFESDRTIFMNQINEFTDKYRMYISSFEVQKFRNTTWSIIPVPDGGLFSDTEKFK